MKIRSHPFPNLRRLAAGLLLILILGCSSLTAATTTALPQEAPQPDLSPGSPSIQPERLPTAIPASPSRSAPGGEAAPQVDNPAPPDQPIKLIFIHHSTGGNWLADPAGNELGGGLGRLLMENKYFASATNYGWGPDAIGDNTDIGHWWDWFRGPQRDLYLEALYAESGQNFGDFGSWPRLESDPGGENQIILFKSCFPNSYLGGNPGDLPTTGENPMRGAFAGDDTLDTVGNAKGIYNDILEYFQTRQDKLFILITAPPLAEWDTDETHASNARALNDWLVNDWLAGYPYNNVAVFDFYNVLTSSAGGPESSDLGEESGNHHRWWNGAVQHLQTSDKNISAYPSGDSHPTQTGNQKAAAEFISLLNVYYQRWAGEVPGETTTYLPLTTRSVLVTSLPSDALIQPSDFTYLGAFRLPGDGERPFTFAYGGSAMTYNPRGDLSGGGDGFPGSLFITGHDRLPYGELPDGSQVAEITIPAPLRGSDLADLPVAGFSQDFHNVAGGHFLGLEELPRIGMLYLDAPLTGPLIHLAWGQHLQPEPPGPTHAWFSPDLSAPDFQGSWYLGDLSPYQANGYMIEIPVNWAETYTQGRVIGAGRYRDGGWSGMGPTLFAYLPWEEGSGAPAPDGAHLPVTTLLSYESSQNTGTIQRCLNGYQHPDEWEGGAWINTLSGKSGVLFAGTKSVGEKYWYGFANPAGPDQPCVEGEMVGQFDLCRLASGEPCFAQDLAECAGHNDYRGWWSTRWEARFILYNPDDLGRVAAGEIQPWEPQPYATLNIDEVLYHNPAGVEPDMLGVGPQRRYRIGEVAYDRENGLLYVLELFADEAKPVVHVWQIGS